MAINTSAYEWDLNASYIWIVLLQEEWIIPSQLISTGSIPHMGSLHNSPRIKQSKVPSPKHPKIGTVQVYLKWCNFLDGMHISQNLASKASMEYSIGIYK